MTTIREVAEFPAERRRIRPAIVVAMAVGICVVLLAVSLGIGWFASEQRVKAELAKIRAAGEPVTPADQEAFYSLPAGSRDTTALWMAAAEAITSSDYQKHVKAAAWIGHSNNTMPPPGDPWPQQDAAEQLLLKYADVLRDLHEASVTGGAARYPTRFSDGIAMKLQPQQSLGSITLLLELDSESKVRSGDAHAAVKSIHALFALARSLDREPLLISQLMRGAKNDAAVRSFERLLVTIDAGEDDLAQIDADLSAIDYFASFHRAILGERVIGMQTFNRPAILGADAPPAGTWNIVRHGDLAVYLQLMEELVAAATAKNQMALRAAMDQAQKKVAEVTSAPSARWRCPMTRLLMPSLKASIDSVGRGTAWRDVARMVVAIERFSRTQGNLPKRLDELVPDFIPNVPVDPFSGGPLRMRVGDDGYCIYSVGPDGVDQGGITEESSTSGDIVFCVPRRKAGEEHYPSTGGLGDPSNRPIEGTHGLPTQSSKIK